MSVTKTFTQSRTQSRVPTYLTTPWRYSTKKIQTCDQWLGQIENVCKDIPNCYGASYFELNPGTIQDGWVEKPGALTRYARRCAPRDELPCAVIETDANDTGYELSDRYVDIRWIDEKNNVSIDGEFNCMWDQQLFTSIAGTHGIKQKYGKDITLKNDFNTTIYPTFCGQKVTTGSSITTIKGKTDEIICSVDTQGDGNPMKECSMFEANLKSGTTTFEPKTICGEWSQDELGAASPVMESYCSANETRDCLCLNPGLLDPALKRLMKVLPATLKTSQACWFTPCLAGTNYLQTKEIVDERSICDKAKICEQIISISNSNNIDLNKISQYMDCGESPPPPANNSTITYVIVAIIFLIIIGVIGYFIYQNQSKKK